MRRILRTLPMVLLLGVLAACGGGGSAGGADEGGFDSAPEPGVDGGAGEDAAGDADREVVITGSMTLVVTDPLAAADEVTAIVEEADGRVDARSQSTFDDSVTAYLTVRIPAADLTETLDEIRDLGEVEDLDISRLDVTLAVTDLDARIEALQVSIDRLETLMAEASSTADLLAAESALTERQAELDSLTAQRAQIAEQVELSTLDIRLLPTQGAAAPTPGGFWGGVQTGWNALVQAFNQAMVVLGVLLPWTVLAAIVVVVVWIVRRNRPRRPPRPPAPGYVGAPVPPPPGGPATAVHAAQGPGPAQGPMPPPGPPPRA